MKKWLHAARLRTLPLSISGIVMGTAAAFSKFHTQENFYSLFILCLIETLFLQVLSNYANDYGDALKGTDNCHRIGPMRAVQSGSISPSQMKKAIGLVSVLSFLTAIAIVWIAFGAEQFFQAIIYILLGTLAIYAAIKYTVGNSAYGYKGFGDIFVFLFFGWVSTLGSYFLYGSTIDWLMLLPASAIGFLSVGVLNMNNMRDIENDAKMNKRTLVVQMGFNNARVYHFTLILLAVLCFNIFAFLKDFRWMEYFYILAYFPLLSNLKKVNQVQEPKLLDSELKKLALGTFFIVLFLSSVLVFF